MFTVIINRGIVVRRQRGSALLTVVVLSAIILFSLAALMTYMNSARQRQAQLAENDRALLVAQSLLAQGASWLRAQTTSPSANSGTAAVTSLTSSDYTNPDADNYNVDLKIYGQRDNNQKVFYTIVSTAAYKGTRTAPASFMRRVQATLEKENFAKYELLVEKTVLYNVSPNWVAYYGLDQVFFGPVHSNSGVGLFPNLWFLQPLTVSVTGNNPIRQYSTINNYWNAVWNQPNSYNFVNMLSTYSTFSKAPKFYGGMQTGSDPISMPGGKESDGMQDLYANAVLKLPADYTGYDSTKGSNFVLVFNDPSSANNDGTVTYKQYLGLGQGNNPVYGPEYTVPIATHNSIAVTGNIIGIQGDIDGRITVGAFDTGTNGAKQGNGQINVTGSLEYESRKNYQSRWGTPFEYSDAPNLFTNNGNDVNLNYVDTLKQQVSRIDDMLGLVSERDIILKERNLEGQRIGNGMGEPNWLYLDAIVMATGTSTPGISDDGTYMPENVTGRPVGKAYRFGNLSGHVKQDWDYYRNGNHTAGFIGPTLYDFRAQDPTQTPPLYPTTTNYLILSGSWREGFVTSMSEQPSLPF